MSLSLPSASRQGTAKPAYVLQARLLLAGDTSVTEVPAPSCYDQAAGVCLSSVDSMRTEWIFERVRLQP